VKVQYLNLKKLLRKKSGNAITFLLKNLAMNFFSHAFFPKKPKVMTQSTIVVIIEGQTPQMGGIKGKFTSISLSAW